MVLAWLLVVALGERASAQEREAPVTLETTGCDAIEREIAELIELELGSLAARSEDAIVARATCGPSEVALRVEAPDHQRAIERVLVVDEGPERARLIALALVELIAASTIELAAPVRTTEEDASVAIEPTRDASAPIAPSEPIAPRGPLGVLVMLTGDLSSAPLAPRGGATLGLDVAITEWLRWTLEARALYGALDTRLATLELGDVSGATSLALLARLDAIELGIAGGFRVGALFVAARAHDAAAYEGGGRDDLYAGPLGRAILEWRMERALCLRVELEVGGTVRAVVATVSPTQEELLRFDGAWGALSVGLSVWP